MKQQKFKFNGHKLLSVGFIFASILASLGFVGDANAVPFQQSFVRLDNMNATQTTGGRACMKPSTTNAAATVASIKLTFPTTGGTDYLVSTVVANWATSVSNLDTVAVQTAMPAITNASITVSGKSVTFPLTTPTVLSSALLYCFNFGAGLTNSSAGAAETVQGTVNSQIAGAVTNDSTTYSLYIITNDQVTISNATVPPSFQFTLNGNSDAFTGNLIPGSVVSTAVGRTIAIVTNAATGWIVWAQDLNSKAGNGALSSTTASYKIGGSTAPTVNGVAHTLTGEDYGMGVTLTANPTTFASVSSGYDGSANQIGSLSPLVYLPIASSTSPTNGDTIQMQERARSSATTPAASDYTDTITFVGAGKF